MFCEVKIFIHLWKALNMWEMTKALDTYILYIIVYHIYHSIWHINTTYYISYINKSIYTDLYLLQISVAPGLPIRECSRQQSTLSIIFNPLWDRTPVNGTQLPIAIACEVDRQQLATWHPETGLTCHVITNLQKKFTVIIVDLFNPQRSVIINRQNVPSIYLRAQVEKRHKIGTAEVKWQKIVYKMIDYFLLPAGVLADAKNRLMDILFVKMSLLINSLFKTL